MDGTRQARLLDSLSTAHRRLSRALDQLLAEEGATVDQWRVLHALEESDGLLMGELTDRLCVPGPSVTRIVDGLVDRALVYRRQAVEDRRRVVAHISDAGRAAVSRMDAIVDAHESQIEESLGEKRFRVLMAAVEDLNVVDPEVR